MERVSLPVWMLYVFVGLGALMIVIFFFGVKDGNSCLENPFTYGAEQYQTEESGPLQCNCNFQNPEYAPFFFNEDNVSVRP